MRNIELKPRIKGDIDSQVQRLLNALDNPDPPLRLADVRTALELDLQYYSSQQTGVLAEMSHRLRVGIHQVIRRPMLLVEVVRKLNLKALWIPDRKRILIDTDEPQLKHRWNEAHEIGHSITPWHEMCLHGDNQRTLTLACHHAVEAEANYAAGRLLFLQDRFATELLDSAIDMSAIRRLKKTYGNSMTTTLWRAVEHAPFPALGVVSVHPHYVPDNFDWVSPCKYFIRSPRFAQQFSAISETQTFRLLRTYCGWQTKGPLGGAEVILKDDNGAEHVFYAESFNNTYETLTIIGHRKRRALAI
jgi:hypothetical protein